MSESAKKRIAATLNVLLILAGLIVTGICAYFAGIAIGYEVYDATNPEPAPPTYEITIYVTQINAIPAQEDADEPEYEIYEITAYTAGPESTGKSPGHPAYGITASGEYVRENHTIACPPAIPFGTRVEIPYFDTVFTCEDRGGAITDGKLDVYMADLDEALAFGRRMLDVKILSNESEDGTNE